MNMLIIKFYFIFQDQIQDLTNDGDVTNVCYPVYHTSSGYYFASGTRRRIWLYLIALFVYLFLIYIRYNCF